jgi:Protein of unknown function (DUF3426)
MVRCGVCQHVFNGLEHLRLVENPKTKTPSPSEAKSSVVETQSHDFGAEPSPPKNTVAPVANSEPTNLNLSKSSDQPLPVIQTDAINRADAQLMIDLDAAQNPPAQVVIPKVDNRPPYDPLISTTTLTHDEDNLHTAFFLPESAPTIIQNQEVQPPRSIQINQQGLVSVGSIHSLQSRSDSIKAPSLSNNDRDDDAVDFFSSDDSYGTTQERTTKIFKQALFAALTFALFLQMALLARNSLWARFPALEPALQTLSSAFGFTLEQPRNLSVLTIESFDVQTTARSDILAVTAILRNQAGFSVNWPAMELTLTGTDGRPVLRKVLTAAEYLNQTPPSRGIPKNSEQPIRIGLQVESVVAKGFSVQIYYP